MIKNSTNNILKDHEKRISALELFIGSSKKQKIKAGKQSLSDHILELRDNGFFSQPKTAEETHTKLNPKYPCESNRVAMALLRLADGRQLRKTSKTISGKKYKAYAR
jgi:hypothetical protein